MKTQLKEFTYDAYLIVILILTFFSFIGPMQPYLLPLLVGMGVLMILAKKSVFYVIPIPFFIQMSFSDLRDNVQVTTVYSLIFLVLIVFQ